MSAAALGDVADFINGFAFKPADWQAAGYPIIRIQNLNDSAKPFNRTSRDVAKKYYVEPGELLVSWSASLGVFTWNAEETGLVNQHIFRVIPDESKVTSGYLRHMLAGALVAMERHLHGATMKHVNRGEFLSTRIPVPPLDEQSRIAAMLDHADCLRAKGHQVLRYLDTLTQSVFHDMFGTSVAGAELGTICKRVTDGTHQSPGWVDAGIPFLFVSNITSGEIELTTQKFISEPTWNELTRRTPIEPGDVLYSTVGSYGIPAVVRTSERFAFQRHIAHIKPDPAYLVPDFLAAQLASPALKRQATLAARGIAQPTVNLAEIKRFKISVPPLAQQDEFSRRAAAIRAKRATVLRGLGASEELFLSLQASAFRGEL